MMAVNQFRLHSTPGLAMRDANSYNNIAVRVLAIRTMAALQLVCCC